MTAHPAPTVEVTLYVQSGSQKSLEVRGRVEAIIARYAPGSIRLVVREAGRDEQRPVIRNLPMIHVRGPAGPQVLLGAIDENDLESVLARNGLRPQPR